MTQVFARSRQYYLDNLKVFLIALVVLHHAGQPYGPGGAWWIAQEQVPLVNLLILGMFMAVNMSFFMGLFFFISAYFIGNSLGHKGSKKYLQDRVIRLAIPLLIFITVVFPIMKYLLQPRSPSFSNFYLNNYLGISSSYSLISLEYLWFLFLLLLFTTTYVVCRTLFRRIKLPETDFPNTKRIIEFIAAMTILVFAVRIWSPINSWLPFAFFEPAHFPQYVMMFFAGLLAYRSDWLNKMPSTAANRWLSIAGWSFLAYGAMYVVWGNDLLTGGLTIPSLAMAAWESTVCLSMSIGLLALFKNRFNSTTTIKTALSKNSYTAYLIHVPIIVGLQYLLISSAVPSLAKFAIVGSAGILLTFLISDLIRRIPFVNRVL